MEEKYESSLRSFMHKTSSITVFRAILHDEEVTVSFSSNASSQETIVTVHCANRGMFVWHDKLERCVAATKNWEWFLCLDQGWGRPGIHFCRLTEKDVSELPNSLRRETGRAACYCQGSDI